MTSCPCWASYPARSRFSSKPAWSAAMATRINLYGIAESGYGRHSSYNSTMVTSHLRLAVLRGDWRCQWLRLEPRRPLPVPRLPPRRPRPGARKAAAHISRQHRPGHDGRDRPQRPGSVCRRPHERRLPDSRGRRGAGHQVVHAGPRRPGPQPADATTTAERGRRHPAAVAAAQRYHRPHLRHHRRRPAPGLPEHRPHPRPFQEDLRDADS